MITLSWRRVRWWLGGVRHGATYKQTLELIAGQGDAMEMAVAGVWAREVAKSALMNEDDLCILNTGPTPKLWQAMQTYDKLRISIRDEQHS